MPTRSVPPVARILLTALAAFLAPALRSQPAADSFNSHEVHADGSVTFRLRDTGASSVSVSMENMEKPIPMTLSGKTWSATTPPLPPESYWYWFVVDGRSELDPVNGEVADSYLFLDSMVRIPSAVPLPWDTRDVPHGVVHHHAYTSHVARGLPGGTEDYYVYTPPGYDPASARAYPVLYLLHGYSQKAADWVSTGRADRLVDNLLADGKAQPMVIVMPLGYGDASILGRGWGPGAEENNALFSRMLTEEIMPRVEADYRVSRAPAGRAIAGLSMGGAQSLGIGLAHPELFAWVGSFSAAGSTVRSAMERGAFDANGSRFRLVWMSCGSREGGTLDANHALAEGLRRRGFSPVLREFPGMHTWMVWHPSLLEFAQLLFR